MSHRWDHSGTDEDLPDLMPLERTKSHSSEWKVFSDYEEDEESGIPLHSSGSSVIHTPSLSSKRTVASLSKSRLSRSTASIYPSTDGRFTEGPEIDNFVEEADLFSAYDPLEIQKNDIGLTSDTQFPIKYSTLKRLGKLCTWLGVLCLFLFGFAIFFAILTLTASITEDSGAPDRFNVTEALVDSNLYLYPDDTMCHLNYSVPEKCTPKVNEIEGCVTGCYLSQSEGDCGMTFTVTYSDIPRTKKLSKIFLLATADGSEFWQTGRPLPVVGDPSVSLINATGSGVIKDGCFGGLGSRAVVACLSQDNLLGESFTSFPKESCIASYGTCFIINNVWVQPIPGCIGPYWVGNNVTIDDIAIAPCIHYSWSVLVGLFIALL